MTRLTAGSTIVSFYCALKKQVLRFTSVYLMRAGYLFAFLFYPRKDRPLQYQDVGYCLPSTVRNLHSLPKSKGALFNFASEKKTTYIYFIPNFTVIFNEQSFFLNNLCKNFYGPKIKCLTNFHWKQFLIRCCMVNLKLILRYCCLPYDLSKMVAVSPDIFVLDGYGRTNCQNDLRLSNKFQKNPKKVQIEL